MNLSMEERVILLEEAVGVVFPDPELALTALTHRSWVNEHPTVAQEDNERLEFLGDAVIELAVSQRLMERFPEAKEGLLSRMRASLVNADILAEVAQKIGLGNLLRLGKGEEMTGGRRKTSLLSNCLEAVVGAIFVQSGLEPIQELADRLLMPHIDRLGLDLSGGRDYKTRVQEEAQLVLGSTPRYRVVGESGPDHEKLFLVEVTIDEEIFGRGEGRSKKEAEQCAAKDALPRLAELKIPAPSARSLQNPKHQNAGEPSAPGETTGAEEGAREPGCLGEATAPQGDQE